MDVTRIGHEMSKFTHREVSGIRRFPHRWQRTVDALGEMLENGTVSLWKPWGTMSFFTELLRDELTCFSEDTQQAGTWNAKEDQSV